MSKFCYAVSIWMPFSGPELAALRRLALLHYDSVCRNIAMRGGWWRGEMVSACDSEVLEQEAQNPEFDDADGMDQFDAALTRSVEKVTTPIDLRLTWNQLDVLAKILEMAVYAPVGKEILLPMQTRIHQAMDAVREESRRVNAS